MKKDVASVNLAKGKGEDARTKFDTIVIDVADIAYDLCEKFILNREGVDKVSEIVYGQGYAMIEKEFDTRLRSIVQMGYGLVLVSHAQFISDDETKIKKATPTLSKRPKKICTRLVDNYIYISMDETPEGIVRTMHFRETPEWEAGSRFKYMPESAPLGFKEYKEALGKAIDLIEKEEGADFVTDSWQNNYAVTAAPDFDKTIEIINGHIQALMGSTDNQEKMATKITGIIENYLGVGKKLADATEKQIEQIIIIEEALEDLVNNK